MFRNMSKDNRISPSPQQDGSSDLKQNTVTGRHTGSQENVTRDVPSNWDIASTPWPEQAGQHPGGQEDHKKLSEWDSDYDSRSNDHFGDANNDDEEAKDLQSDKTKEVDKGPARKKDVYTPELPEAGTIQESVYNSPNASDTDLNSHRELAEMKEDTSPKAKHKTYAVYKEEATEMEIKQRDTCAPVELKSNSLVFMAHPGKNRVSPIDDEEVQKAKGKYYAISEEEQQKKKSRVFGDVPSNWDIASTPWPEQAGQHPGGQEDHKKLSEWDSDYDSRSNDHFGDANNDDEEAKDLQSDKTKEVDKGPARKKDVYTPELPEAGTIQESVYNSPNASDTDLNSHRELAEMKEDTSPKAKHKTYAVYKEEATEMEIKQRDTCAPVELKSNSLVFMAHPGKNRVSPIDDEEVQKAKGKYYAISEEEQQKKKSRVFGADDNTDGVGCCGWLLYAFSILLIVVSLPFSLIFCIKVVQEYERAVIFRLGRLPSGGAKGPGIFFIIPCIESYTKIDLRTVSFDVPPQEVLTKDSVTVSVDAVVYYRVSNPTVSVANVENAHHSTRLLAQTTLRNILGTKNMSEILSDRESISQGMQSTLDEATDNWGIKVERVEIKDVRLPVQLQRAMAAEAEAAREARAKVIAAEGEQKASHSLKDAADVMAKSSAALQLRYLQTLSSISAEKNSTIIFPLPIDLVKAFMDKKF